MAIRGAVGVVTVMVSLCLICEGREFASEVDEACAADAVTCSGGGSAMMQQKVGNTPVRRHSLSQADNQLAIFYEDKHFLDELNQTLLAKSLKPHVGLSAGLNEMGYQSVLQTRSDDDMGVFVLRVVEKMNMSVPASNITNHPIFSFASWYSGRKASQSFAGLQKELKSIRRKCSWIKPIILTESGSGKVAHLTEEGYQSVALQRDSSEMIDFVRRVMDELHMHVVDEDGLKGFVPYFDCTKGSQTYNELRTELEKRAAEGAWVQWDAARAQTD